MAQPYVGEIRMFGGNFAPAGWMFCSGQTLPISEYETLFNLIGTTYGGDGQSTFGLPNLAGCLPMHQGTMPSGDQAVLGEYMGSETVTLTQQQIPAHSHSMVASTDVPANSSAQASVLGQSASKNFRALGAAPTLFLDPMSVSSMGGSQPHENMQPYLCVSFIISLFGIFPSQ